MERRVRTLTRCIGSAVLLVVGALLAAAVAGFGPVAALGSTGDVVVVPAPPAVVADVAWPVSEGVSVEGSAPVPDPASVDTTLADDAGRLDAYVATLTVANGGRRYGSARWMGEAVTYRISLPASYPAGVATEVRLAYRWMSEVTGLTISEVTAGAADIIVVGYGNNGGLTRFDALGGELGNVNVSIGCCRRRAVWEEVLHSMGLYSDRGPAGSLVSEYGTRTTPVDVPSTADATVLRALYQGGLRRGAGDAEVRSALVEAARR